MSVCQVSVCAGNTCFLNEFILLYACVFGVFECVCVHLRPLAPHHQDTGLNGGSYSPFPTALSQQVAPNVLFSLRKLLAFPLFLCSYLFFFYLSPPLKLFLAYSRLLLLGFWLPFLFLSSYKWLFALTSDFVLAAKGQLVSC